MNQELGFETIPFEIDPEYGARFRRGKERGVAVDRRPEAGRDAYSRPRSQTGRRPRAAGSKSPCPTAVRPGGPRAVVFEPYGLASEPYPGEPEPAGTEHVRWVQGCLNQVMGLQLPLDGIMGPPVRSAIRSFQARHKLRVDGLVGPDTEQALKGACKAEISQLRLRNQPGVNLSRMSSPENCLGHLRLNGLRWRHWHGAETTETGLYAPRNHAIRESTSGLSITASPRYR